MIQREKAVTKHFCSRMRSCRIIIAPKLVLQISVTGVELVFIKTPNVVVQVFTLTNTGIHSKGGKPTTFVSFLGFFFFVMDFDDNCSSFQLVK